MEKDKENLTDEELIAKNMIEADRKRKEATDKWLDEHYDKEARRKVIQNLRDNYYLFRDIQTKGHGSVNIISNDDGMDGK